MIKKYIEGFLKLISQQPPIGGLDITPEALRYSLIVGSNMRSASLRLPPNLIDQKGIVDVNNFVKALESLRGQIENKSSVKKPINVVVALPFASTYLQTFKIPVVADKDVESAAELNMQMISPIPISGAYYDFEQITSGDDSPDGQTEFIGAFASALEVDSFVSALKRAGFSVVAVEFSSLALTRVASDLNINRNSNDYYIVIHSGYTGVDFLVVRGKNLYFDYFVSWQALGIGQGGLTTQALAPALARSLQQVINYAASKWGGVASVIYLTTTGSDEVFKKALASSFNIQIEVLTSRLFPQADTKWMTSIGLALRGAIPRSKDSLITLSRVDTQDEYRANQIVAFINFWRIIVISTLTFMLVVFFTSDVFLTRAANSVLDERKSQSPFLVDSIREEVVILEQEAREFNELILSVDEAKKLRFSWRPFLFEINKIAGNSIEVNRIFYQSENAPVVLTGIASEEQAVLDFKDRLEMNQAFSEVELPLNNIFIIGNQVSFNLSFVINDLEAL